MTTPPTRLVTSPNSSKELSRLNSSNSQQDQVDSSEQSSIDLLVQEIESGEAPTNYIFRAIYDGDEHQKFMERLDARIKNRDRDIERMCNFHYQGFIESIRELLQVRNQAQKLKNEIQQADVDLQKSAAKLLTRGEELVKLRKVQTNITSLIESLSNCLPILQMYAKLEKQMKEKRYYPALKTLEQLEHSYLPLVANYEFFQQMRNKIPDLRQNIKDASLSDLNDFLGNVRQKSPEIGARVMQHVLEQNNMDPNLMPKKVCVNNHIENNRDSSDQMSPQDIVQFYPVYRCLHIHSVLGARDSFVTNYQNQRREQAELAQEPPPNMRTSIDRYRDYLCGIVGFFVVEEHVLNTTDGLVNRNYLNDLWEKAVSKINSSIRREAACCKDDEFMIKIINIVMLFRQTIQGYGYSVQRLSYLGPELQAQYMEILRQLWFCKFKDILDHDTYNAIVAKNEDEYSMILDMFPYKDEVLEKSSFPKRFPFSYMVPKVYDQIIKFVNACRKFLTDLHLNQTEANDMLKKSTNLLLTTLSNCLSTSINGSTVGLSQSLQFMININYLEESCANLEQTISCTLGIQSQTIFKKARSDGEARVYFQLQNNIKEFIELADYDWLLPELPVEDGKISGKASEFVVDMTTFLKTILFSSTNPPVQLVQTACMRVCMHISQHLMKFLTDDKTVKQISKGALQQLSLDVTECENFAKEPVSGLDEGTLLMYFADLRQILNLFLDWDWSIYFHDYGCETSKYLRVSPDAAIILLEKYREGENKNKMFVFSKKSREKKKLLETVLKQLRSLTANGTTKE